MTSDRTSSHARLYHLDQCLVEPEFASNLSDQAGKLAKTFLYLSEAGMVVQRECAATAPKTIKDCGIVRSSQSEAAFSQAVDEDIKISLTRLQAALTSLKKDRTEVQNRTGWNLFTLTARKGLEGPEFYLDDRDALKNVSGFETGYCSISFDSKVTGHTPFEKRNIS